MAEEIGSLAVKIGLDSSGFQGGISNINRELKVLDSEFKANTASLGANAKGLDGLKVKSESLVKTLELQKQKVATLEGAYQKSADSKGKDAKATQDLEIKLNNAKAALSKTETALSSTNKQIDIQSSKWTTLGKSAESAGNKISAIGKGATSAGKSLTIGVTAPILAIGTAAIKTGMDFDAQMSRVQAISGATADEFKKLNDQALQLGADTAFSASEVAQGMENMASAGFNTEQVMAAMPGMLSLAAAGGVDIATASDVAASALNGFGLEAGDAGHVADVLARAAADTNAGVTDMGQALKYAAPPAKALGVSLEEVSAAIGIMSNAGIKGESAGTALRGALTKLSSPSKEAATMMKDLGINAFDSNGKMLPLSQVVGNLQDKMKGLTDEQKANAIATIFGQESMSGMLTLIQAGPAGLDKLTTGFKNSDGAAAEMASTMQNNTESAVEQMTGSLDTAGIKLEQALAPAIKGIADAVGGLADTFATLSPQTQMTIITVLGLAAALGPVLIIVGSMISAVGAIVGVFGAASVAIGAAGGMLAILTGPIGIAIAAIAVLVGGGILLYKNWDTIKATAGQVWEGIKTTVGNAINGIVGFFTGLPAAASTAWANTTAGAAQFIQGLQTSFVTGVKNIVTGFINGFNGIIAGLAGIWTGIQAAVGAAINGIVQIIQSKFGAQIILIQEIFGRIANVFRLSWEIIKNIFLGAILLILDLVTGNFTKLQTDAVSIWNNISAYFETIWYNIKTIFIYALQIITITATDAWNGITSFIVNTWNALVSTLQGAFTAFVTFIATTWTNITTNTTNAWNNLKTAVSNIVTNTITAIKGFFTGLVTFFQTLPATLQTLGTNMFTSMKTGATNAITGLVAAVKTGIGQAITWITSLPSQAVTWGSDIIQGIVTGIQNAAGAVGKAVEGVAQDIRNFLHFSVPDKGPLSDFDTYMPDMIDLMVIGINGNKSKLFDTVKGLASGMSIGIKDTARTFSATGVSWNGKSGTLDSPNNSGTGASANGGGLIVQIENFNNARSQDVQSLAEELSFYMRQKNLGLGVG